MTHPSPFPSISGRRDHSWKLADIGTPDCPQESVHSRSCPLVLWAPLPGISLTLRAKARRLVFNRAQRCLLIELPMWTCLSIGLFTACTGLSLLLFTVITCICISCRCVCELWLLIHCVDLMQAVGDFHQRCKRADSILEGDESDTSTFSHCRFWQGVQQRRFSVTNGLPTMAFFEAKLAFALLVADLHGSTPPLPISCTTFWVAWRP